MPRNTSCVHLLKRRSGHLSLIVPSMHEITALDAAMAIVREARCETMETPTMCLINSNSPGNSQPATELATSSVVVAGHGGIPP